MAASRKRTTQHTSATADGFCLCHLKSFWYHLGRLGLYLGYYNVSYAESQQRFVCDEQLYVHLVAIVNLFCSVAYLWLSQHWIYDSLIFLLYVPLYIYFLLLRQHLTRLLNEGAAIHGALEQTLGELLCVRIRKATVLMLLVPALQLLLLMWQAQMYYCYQIAAIAGAAIIYHMMLMFLANYLIWLACIYRALSIFLAQHMNCTRLEELRQILRQQPFIESLHLRVCRSFALHLLSFLTLLAVRIWQLLEPHFGWPSRQGTILHLRTDRMLLCHLTLLVFHLITLMVIAHDLQRQRWRFERNFLHLADEPKYFVLKSWRLLKHNVIAQPFGVPLMRIVPRRRAKQRRRDIIHLLFSTNFCVTSLCRAPLVIVVLGKFSRCYELRLSLPLLMKSLIKLTILLLLSLYQRLILYSHIKVDFYSSYAHNDFDVNVTKSLSQVYRFYYYDEME
ncbi:uncharacterized protein LOC115622446 [Scaptodrosophila lebanonensis]|uniref:Uncharacterized protein LOC115622446 n=1 Tax=Drosophila lebanonensis TaxID=7225 RepID=A0A6J2TBB9_DROLE|nr:uncharacterized protein LOC115622446 [Scaptodrosophila lebanonensis]